jgi:hypothetical protein
MAHLQPKVSEYSLMRKVKNGRIVQDTGTGGAYPASTDRMIWAVAAWELFKATGDMDWLKNAFSIIKNSVNDDMKNAYNPLTGMVKGESSFLDWREQTYPRWMQPVDIYHSENLGTNAVHYQANIVLSEMASILEEANDASFYKAQAEKIKAGINKYLWVNNQGYYAQYLYGRNYKIVSPRSEALGEALTVLFGIAGEEQQKSVIAKTPVMDFGIPCIFPQIPGIPPYHNNAVWPFVQSYWALAAAKAGNEQSLTESIAAVYRPAALFLTNKENFVAESGDFAGTQINSSNMLWSLSGSLGIVHKILFGIEFSKDQLVFHPFVPKTLQGKHLLSNFRYRNAVLDIEVNGHGNVIRSFEIDGKAVKDFAIPADLSGNHSIKIELITKSTPAPSINKVENYFSPDVPALKLTDNILSWQSVPRAVKYAVLQNGKNLAETAGNSFRVNTEIFSEYQVIALDKNGVGSFASEPVEVKSKYSIVVEVEDFAGKSELDYKNFFGTGFSEISTSKNKTISIPVNISKAGKYCISFRYANGNGPVNTENKCAIRTLKTDGTVSGTLVLPQRGKNEWSNWGISNYTHVRLSKGKHVIEVSYEPWNENMNGEINQAMLDALILEKLD